MRKLFFALLAALLLVCIPISAGAVTGADKVNIQATVSSDGSAQVLQTVTLQLDTPVEDLTYPIPENATAVTLNGSRVSTIASDGVRHVRLSRIAGKVAGQATFTVGYRLNDLVQATPEGLLQLQLPMLSGFPYPVQALDFTVTMPMEVTVKPAFTSGYHLSSIESLMDFDYSGTLITGSAKTELKDHETLAMNLSVSEDIFPQQTVELPSMSAVLIAMGVASVLALLYYLIWLRNLPYFPHKTPTAPAGCTAGQLGSVLSMQGPELPLVVLTWAQLGYVLIHIDRNHLVTIHKCMEMGNERSGFERRVFKAMFSKRNFVDTSGRHWMLLCKKVQKTNVNTLSFLHHRSGNPLVFRGLCAAISLLGGVCLGLMLGSGAALQWPLVVLLAGLGAVAGWFIQQFAYGLFSFQRRQVWVGLSICCVYLIFSAIAGLFGQGVLVCLSQLLGGLMAAFGGRRTEAGKHAMAQTLGLRRYLCSLPKAEVQRLCEKDPDFFHSMLPYAVAMGAGKTFSKRFGAAKQPPCPYLTSGMDGHRTAGEWYEMMRDAINAMYLRQRRQPVEKLQNLFYRFKK